MLNIAQTVMANKIGIHNLTAMIDLYIMECLSQRYCTIFIFKHILPV